ncbi:MAG: hypothetical protein ABJZ56_03495 [Paracoccaceae bacterium]
MNLSLFSKQPECIVGLSSDNKVLNDIFPDIKIEIDEDMVNGYAELFDCGINLIFKPDEADALKVHAVFLFVTQAAAVAASEFENYSVYKENLPYGLDVQDTKDNVKEKMGVPEFVRDEIENDMVGFLGSTFRYEISSGKKLIVEFKNNTVYRLVVRRA